MMTKGWWIYAAVLMVMTAVAVGGSGNGADVLVALVANFVFLVLLPRSIQLGWKRIRAGRTA